MIINNLCLFWIFCEDKTMHNMVCKTQTSLTQNQDWMTLSNLWQQYLIWCVKRLFLDFYLAQSVPWQIGYSSFRYLHKHVNPWFVSPKVLLIISSTLGGKHFRSFVAILQGFITVLHLINRLLLYFILNFFYSHILLHIVIYNMLSYNTS